MVSIKMMEWSPTDIQRDRNSMLAWLQGEIGHANISSPVVILQDQVPNVVKALFEQRLQPLGPPPPPGPGLGWAMLGKCREKTYDNWESEMKSIQSVFHFIDANFKSYFPSHFPMFPSPSSEFSTNLSMAKVKANWALSLWPRSAGSAVGRSGSMVEMAAFFDEKIWLFGERGWFVTWFKQEKLWFIMIYQLWANHCWILGWLGVDVHHYR